MHAMFCIIKMATFISEPIGYGQVVCVSHTSVAMVRWPRGGWGVVVWEQNHPAAPRCYLEWRTDPLTKDQAHTEYAMMALAIMHEEHMQYIANRALARKRSELALPRYESFLEVM